MFAQRHALFVGPGKLPDELRQVLAKRAHAIAPDIAIQVPRLLAIFDTAAEAERVSSQVQRLKMSVATAGPEQPPAELSWSVARSLTFFGDQWRLETTASEHLAFAPKDITAITLLEWRPDAGAADRAVLITLREQKPVMLRASLLDTVSRHSLPMFGLRSINEVLDAASLALTPDVKIRSRKLNEADFRGGELTGDLLPLILAVVDAVDTMPGELPQPLQGKRTAPTVTPPHRTALAALSAWVLYLMSLPTLVLSLAFFTIAALTFFTSIFLGVLNGLLGVVLFAWGTRRFMWSRWLARSNWGEGSPVPAWPIHPNEPGIQPKPLELSLDALALVLISVGVFFSEGVARQLSIWSLPFLLVTVLTSTAAVYEAWQRE